MSASITATGGATLPPDTGFAPDGTPSPDLFKNGRAQVSIIMARHARVLADYFRREPRRRITGRNLSDLAFALRVTLNYPEKSAVEADAASVLDAAIARIEARSKTADFELDPLELRVLRLANRIHSRHDREAQLAQRLAARAAKRGPEGGRARPPMAGTPSRSTERLAARFPALADPIRDAALASASA